MARSWIIARRFCQVHVSVGQELWHDVAYIGARDLRGGAGSDVVKPTVDAKQGGGNRDRERHMNIASCTCKGENKDTRRRMPNVQKSHHAGATSIALPFQIIELMNLTRHASAVQNI